MALRSMLRLAAAWLVALACGAASANAAVVEAAGHRLGVTPAAAAQPRVLGASASAGDSLTYHGGPVLHSSAPYLILWAPPSGTGIPAGEQSLLTRYFTDVAAASGTSSDVYAVDRQFTDASGYADNRQSFDGASQVITDTQPYPALDTTTCRVQVGSDGRCVTDGQITSEITRLIAARGLPTDGPAGAAQMPDHAPIYFVVLPSDVNVCYPGQCADQDFCAYHSYLDAGGSTVLYAVLPTVEFAAGQNPKGCQADGQGAVQEPNGDPGDVVLKYASHEDSETMTDPRFDGWHDDTSYESEDGDLCNAYGSTADPAAGVSPTAFAPTLGGSGALGTLYDQSINGHPYYLQSEWSNGDGSCRLMASGAALTPAFTTQTGGGTGLTFDGSATSASTGVTSATWDFGDGTAAAFRTGGTATGALTHTYASPGTYTATLTVVDGSGDLATVSHPVIVGPLPTPSAAVVTAHPGTGQPTSFTASSGWASYKWDFGDGTATETASATASHAYATPGTYTVTVTVADLSGRTTSTSTAVTVAGPSPLLALTAASTGAASHFSGAGSVDSGGAITAFAWNFGDGRLATGVAVDHVYAAPGTYLVTLTLTDAAGFTTAVTREITVAPAPAPSAPRAGSAPPPPRGPVRARTASVGAGDRVTVAAGGRARAWDAGAPLSVRVSWTTVRLTPAELRALLRHRQVRIAVQVPPARAAARTARARQARTRSVLVRLRLRAGRRYVSATLAG